MLKKLKKHTHFLHNTGMVLSIICLIHCLATPLVITLLPMLGKNWVSHNLEIALTGLSFVLGSSIMFKDFKVHGSKQPFILMFLSLIFYIVAFTISGQSLELYFLLIGAAIMAAAYYFNWNLHRKVCNAHSH